MKDFRCGNCNKLLAKIDEKSRVEIQCPKCKTLNGQSELMNIDEPKKYEVPIYFKGEQVAELSFNLLYIKSVKIE